MNLAPSLPSTCILAMDTATGPSSVALWKDSAIAAYVENHQSAMQSASLIPMVEEALAQAGVRYHDLTALAVTIGPGSFTGIRVALAAARAICFATGVAGMGYTTLDVLSFAARQKAHGHILAMLNAGKGEQYYQYYHSSPWQASGPPQLDRLDTALLAAPQGHITIAGNAPVHDVRFEISPVTSPRADALAELAACHPELAHRELHPFYIRPPDAKLPQSSIQPPLKA